jgi:hypothetical protein
VNERNGSHQAQIIQAWSKQHVPLHLSWSHDDPNLGGNYGVAPEVHSEHWHAEDPCTHAVNVDAVLVPKDAVHPDPTNHPFIFDDLKARRDKCSTTNGRTLLSIGSLDNEVGLVEGFSRLRLDGFSRTPYRQRSPDSS